jgi:hypothetical protein
MPHVISYPPPLSVEGGVSGNAPDGAGMITADGMLLYPEKRGAVSGVRMLAGLEICVVKPNEPFLSKEFTMPSPK